MTNKPHKIKVVFVLPDLKSGGAERVMSFVAKNLSRSKFEPYLLLAGFKKDSVYDTENVISKYYNKGRVLYAIPYFFIELIKLKPDIVVSSISHLNTAMAMISFFFPRTKFIGREANVLSVFKKHKQNSNIIGGLISPKKSYKYLDIVLCQSKDMFNDMEENFDVPREKLRIINNPMTDNFPMKTIEDSDKDKSKVKFITVGRLKPQKGHKRIIRALSKLTFPFHYTIVGDGPEKLKLLELINELGLTNNITHVPFTKEVSKFLSQNDFFLQGSFVEGFPNCLIESCSVGTPVIAYRAPGGLDEIIEEGINGFIAETDKDYIDAIIKAKNGLNDWNPEHIRKSVHKKFNKDLILKQYEDLFQEVSKL